MYILLIEDNAADVALLKELLPDTRNVEIQWVDNGAEALDCLYRRGAYRATRRPDLILLDLGLPKIGGYDVLKALKEDTNLSSIPVIVLSTSRNPLDRQETQMLGARMFLSKPQNLEGYEQLVDQLMENDIPRLTKH